MDDNFPMAAQMESYLLVKVNSLQSVYSSTP